MAQKLPEKRPETGWGEMFQLRHKWLLQLRCVTAICGTACIMYAFTHIAFAEVYAIAFMTVSIGKAVDRRTVLDYLAAFASLTCGGYLLWLLHRRRLA